MIEILVILLCLLLNALLAGAEMAFVTIGKARLRQLAKSGNVDAKRILALREKPERTLSIIQVGITVVGIIAAAVGGAGTEEVISPFLIERLGVSEGVAEVIGILVIVIPLTYLNVVVGELVPKTLALRDPQRAVLSAAKWLVLFDRMLAPVVTLLEWSTRKILGTVFRRRAPMAPSTVPDMVELDHLTQETKQYVLNLVNIEKKHVKDVMLPWHQVQFVDTSQSVEEVEALVLSSGHTRLPVLSGGKVTGIMNTKEFLALRKTGATSWTTVVRPLVQVLEADSIMGALRLMQERRSHMSVVFAHAKDQRTGIVTMEDILEEVVGDIFDEDDDGALRRILSTASTFRTTGPVVKL
jgi:putative hemolysin